MPHTGSPTSWLRDHLAERGWSRLEAARQLGIGRMTVLRILNEPGWTPSPRTVARLEQGFGLPSGWIRDQVHLGPSKGQKAVATKQAKDYDFQQWSAQARAGHSPNWAAKAAGRVGGRRTVEKHTPADLKPGQKRPYFVQLGKQSWAARKGEAAAPHAGAQAKRAKIPRGPRIAKTRFLRHRGPGSGGGAITLRVYGPDGPAMVRQLQLRAKDITTRQLIAWQSASDPRLRPLFDRYIKSKPGPRPKRRQAHPGRPPKITGDKLLADLAAGLSTTDIAHKHHVSLRTIQAALQALGRSRPRGRPGKSAETPGGSPTN